VDNDNTDAARVTADAMRFEPVIVAPLVAAPILFILLVYLLISTSKWNRRRKEHRSRDEIQETIGQMAADDVTAAQALGDTGKKKKKKKFKFGKKKKTGGKPKADSPDNTGPET